MVKPLRCFLHKIEAASHEKSPRTADFTTKSLRNLRNWCHVLYVCRHKEGIHLAGGACLKNSFAVYIKHKCKVRLSLLANRQRPEACFYFLSSFVAHHFILRKHFFIISNFLAVFFLQPNK